MYSVNLVGHPTSNNTRGSRSYTITVRICTDGETCELFPAKINKEDITYPGVDAQGNADPALPRVRPIPPQYDLTFFGCPDEKDEGAVLTSSSAGEEVDAEYCDFEDLKLQGSQRDGRALEETDCICCRLYTFSYAGQAINGLTQVKDIIASCPDITIDSVTVEEPLDTAEFDGFYLAGGCCEDAPYSMLQEHNYNGQGDIDCLKNAHAAKDTALRTAEQTYEAALKACPNVPIAPGAVNTCQQLALQAYQASQRAANATFLAAIRACNQNSNITCNPMTRGDCIRPILPNGTALQLATRTVEKIIRIRHFAATHDADFFSDFEEKINCDQFRLVVACKNWWQVFAPRTLKLEHVDANTTELNGLEIWQRTYQFHWKKDGWDVYAPNIGTDRAVCLGAPEGTAFLDDQNVCQFGKFDTQDCLSDCPSTASKAGIVDHLGNPIHEPMNLTVEGQPACAGEPTNFLKWKQDCCRDFRALGIPNFVSPDIIRTGPIPNPVPPPEATCDANVAGSRVSIYYTGSGTVPTIFNIPAGQLFPFSNAFSGAGTVTFECQCTPACQWVQV